MSDNDLNSSIEYREGFDQSIIDKILSETIKIKQTSFHPSSSIQSNINNDITPILDNNVSSVQDINQSIDIDEDEYNSFTISNDQNQLIQQFSDYSLDESTRNNILNKLLSLDSNILVDIISDHCSSFLDSEYTMLEDHLQTIANNTQLLFPLRLKCARCIKNNNLIIDILQQAILIHYDNRPKYSITIALIFDEAIKLLDHKDDVLIYEKEINQLMKQNTNSKDTLTITLLNNNEKHINDSISKNKLSDSSLDILTQIFIFCITDSYSTIFYSYKLLHRLSISSIDSNRLSSIIDSFILWNINHTHYSMMYHILSLQQLLKINLLSSQHLDSLLSIIKHKRYDLAYNDLGDAADFLLSIKIPTLLSYVKKGQDLLLDIDKEGVQGGIWSSKQTIHQVSSDIDSFINNILNDITPAKNISSIILDIINNNSSYFIHYDNLIDTISKSILRIEYDLSHYGTMKYSLHIIFSKIITYILHHTFSHSLQLRLIEELYEMSSTCTSGHILRLMNIFSGFEESTIRLDPSIEIKGIVFAKLQKYIQSLPIQHQELIYNAISENNDIEELLPSGEGANIRRNMFNIVLSMKNDLINDYVNQGLISTHKLEEIITNIVTSFFTA